MQRALMHYFKPYNRELVLAALKKAGREDLIGWGPECLITPYERKTKGEKKPAPRERGREAPGKPGKRPDSGRHRTSAKHNDAGRHTANGRNTR